MLASTNDLYIVKVSKDNVTLSGHYCVNPDRLMSDPDAARIITQIITKRIDYFTHIVFIMKSAGLPLQNAHSEIKQWSVGLHLTQQNPAFISMKTQKMVSKPV